MKVLLTIALFLSFLSVAVFGFLAINHGSDKHNACIAAIAGKMPCLAEEGLLSLINFHLNALKSFSMAVFDLAQISAFNVALIFLSLMFLGRLFVSRFIPVLSKFVSPGFEISKQPNLFKINFIRWLSLHENSPTLVFEMLG